MRRFAAGLCLAPLLVLGTVRAGETPQRFTHLGKALEAAAAGGKDVFLHFNHSDWKGPCRDLTDKILANPEWLAYAAKHFVVVEIDDSPAVGKSALRKAYQEEVRRRFGVHGYPAVFLLDSRGMPYGQAGYDPKAASPKLYIANIAAMAPRKRLIIEGVAAAKKGRRKDKLAASVKLYEKLRAWYIDYSYPGLKTQIVRLDADNKGGYRLFLAEQLALYYCAMSEKDKSDYFLGVLEKLDTAKAALAGIKCRIEVEAVPLLKDNKHAEALVVYEAMMKNRYSGEAAQYLYYNAGFSAFEIKDHEKTFKYLDAAYKAAPNTELGRRADAAIHRLTGEGHPAP